MKVYRDRRQGDCEVTQKDRLSGDYVDEWPWCANHNRVLMRIAAEESDDQCQVVYRLVFSTSNEQDTGSTPSYDAEKDDDSAAAEWDMPVETKPC